MEWLIVPTTIPAAVDFGVGGAAAVVAFAVAAVPACVLMRRAPYQPELQVVAEPSDKPMRRAA
jgi:hypothetical protein